MIDLKTEEGRAKVADMFRKDLNQPALRFALHRSFSKYADLRDQLIDAYSRKTRLPKEFFERIMIDDQVKTLIG